MVIHGWTIYLHPCFEAQFNRLIADALAARERRPDDFRKSNAFKRLAAVIDLAFDQIPRDPTDARFRQGNTLGKDRKHWFRAKFFQQYRLFFRFSEARRVIIYAWVNDEETLRAYGSKTDAYTTFSKMVDSGVPPDDWEKLKAKVIQDAAAEGLRANAAALQADIDQ